MQDVHLDLLSGAIASGATRFVVGPLDVVKIRFQVQSTRPGQSIQYTSIPQAFRHIVKAEGFLALWKGNMSAIAMYLPWGSIQFATFHSARRFLWPDKTPANLSTLQNLTCGSLAGLMCTLATYPFDFLRTRMAVQQNTTIMSVPLRTFAREAMQDHGIRGIYVGLWPAIIGQLPYTAFSFTVYHGLKSKLDPTSSGSTTVSLTSGLVAGTASKLLTMPLDVIKKRYQTMNYDLVRPYPARTMLASAANSGTKSSTNVSRGFSSAAACSRSQAKVGVATGARVTPRDMRYTGVLNTAVTIARTEGTLALYRGSVLSILKAAPAAAVNFTAYEYVRRVLVAVCDDGTERDR